MLRTLMNLIHIQIKVICSYILQPIVQCYLILNQLTAYKNRSSESQHQHTRPWSDPAGGEARRLASVSRWRKHISASDMLGGKPLPQLYQPLLALVTDDIGESETQKYINRSVSRSTNIRVHGPIVPAGKRARFPQSRGGRNI